MPLRFLVLDKVSIGGSLKGYGGIDHALGAWGVGSGTVPKVQCATKGPTQRLLGLDPILGGRIE